MSKPAHSSTHSGDSYRMTPARARKSGPIAWPLWWRIWRDHLGLMILSAGVMLGWHWLWVSFLPMYEHRYKLGLIRQLPKIFKAMVGEDLFQMITPTALNAFAYGHPITLVVIMAFVVVIVTDVIVGQIDRGTIDLILATPLTRLKMMTTIILVSLVGGALLVAAMLAGTGLGLHYTQLVTPVKFSSIVICAINVYVLYVCVLGCAVFISSLSSIRSWAVGWAIGISLASYLLHFLAEWWSLAAKISFIGPLKYFHPVRIAATGQWPSRDLAVLGAAGAVLMVTATIIFCRRNITTT